MLRRSTLNIIKAEQQLFDSVPTRRPHARLMYGHVGVSQNTQEIFTCKEKLPYVDLSL